MDRYFNCGRLRVSDVEADQRLSDGGSLCEKYGAEYSSVPRASGIAVQYSFRLRGGFCRSRVLRGDRGASSDEAPVWNCETDFDDSGLFPGGRLFLPVM